MVTTVTREPDAIRPEQPDIDGAQRRALLLHLGDALETVACLMKCGAHHHTVGEAAAQEKSLPDFPLLRHVDSELTPTEFVTLAASAFFLWPKQLLEAELNRNAIAHLVQHDLFSGNHAGWAAYVNEIRQTVPWFGEGLETCLPDPFAVPGQGTVRQADATRPSGEPA
nr:hypothetical protein HUO10_005301 [Paraburkholderia busanensis]